MQVRPFLFVGAAAATLLLAACHRSEPPLPPDENDAMVVPEPAVAPEPAPRVVEAPRAEAPKPRPAPEVSADQQVQDDADATGMTARVSRGDDDAGDSQPTAGGGNSQD